jgi:hypothetical protein
VISTTTVATVMANLTGAADLLPTFGAMLLATALLIALIASAAL